MSTCFSFCNHQLGESEQQSDRETCSKPSQRPKASSSPGQIVNSSQETTRAQSRRQQTQSACRRAKVCECGDYYFNFLICKCCCFFSCQLALSYFETAKCCSSLRFYFFSLCTSTLATGMARIMTFRGLIVMDGCKTSIWPEGGILCLYLSPRSSST